MNLPYSDMYIKGYGGPGTHVLVPRKESKLLNKDLKSKSEQSLYYFPVLASDEEVQLLTSYPNKLETIRTPTDEDQEKLTTHNEWYRQTPFFYLKLTKKNGKSMTKQYTLSEIISPDILDVRNINIVELLKKAQLRIIEDNKDVEKPQHHKIIDENPFSKKDKWYLGPEGKQFKVESYHKKFILMQRESKNHKSKNISLSIGDAVRTSMLMHNIDKNFRNVQLVFDKLSQLLCSEFVKRNRMVKLLTPLAPQLPTVITNEYGSHNTWIGDLTTISECTLLEKPIIICDPKIITKNGQCSSHLLISYQELMFYIDPITHHAHPVTPEEITYKQCDQKKYLYKVKGNPFLNIGNNDGKKTFLYYTFSGCKFHQAQAQSIRLKISQKLEKPSLDVQRLSELLKFGVKYGMSKKQMELQQILHHLQMTVKDYADHITFAKNFGIDSKISASEHIFTAWTKTPIRALITYLTPTITIAFLMLILYCLWRKRNYLPCLKKRRSFPLKTVNADETPNNKESVTTLKAIAMKPSTNRVVFKDGKVVFERGNTSVE